MPRKLRAQYPGTIYHVVNRGDRREKIFAHDRDRQRFLQTLGGPGPLLSPLPPRKLRSFEQLTDNK